MPGIVFFWWKVERFLPLTNHLRQLTDCRHLVNYSLHEKVEVTLNNLCGHSKHFDQVQGRTLKYENSGHILDYTIIEYWYKNKHTYSF